MSRKKEKFVFDFKSNLFVQLCEWREGEISLLYNQKEEERNLCVYSCRCEAYYRDILNKARKTFNFLKADESSIILQMKKEEKGYVSGLSGELFLLFLLYSTAMLSQFKFFPSLSFLLK